MSYIPKPRLAFDQIPWAFLLLAIAALAVQLVPAWQTTLIYDRIAVEHGELWRIWTGNIVHFGWTHMLLDTGLFLVLGLLLERKSPWQSYLSLVGMPVAIAGALYLWDHEMVRYAGLSGLNFGLLVFVALSGWQKNWVDWFWPAVLGAYLVELYLEIAGAGHGGGAIKFSDPTVHIATIAHVGGGLFGLGLWLYQLQRKLAKNRTQSQHPSHH